MTDMMIPTWTTAERIRKARHHAGLSSAQLAERIGVGERTIRNYESGYTSPRPAALRLISVATGVPIVWLTEGEVGEHGPTWNDVIPGQGQFLLDLVA